MFWREIPKTSVSAQTNMVKLCLEQDRLGGKFYLLGLSNHSFWRRRDESVQELCLKTYYSTRHSCMDELEQENYPQTCQVRVQTNDPAFANNFRQCCSGHDGVPHHPDRKENLDHLPLRFSKRVSQLLKKEKGLDLRTAEHRCTELRKDPDCQVDIEDHLDDWYHDYNGENVDFAAPAIDGILREPPDSDDSPEMTIEQRLRRVHNNLGHPSKALMLRILREAKAPDMVIEVAQQFECEVCQRLSRVKPARPANPDRARQLGEVVSLDMSYHTRPDGLKFVVINLIDEASRFHVGKVAKQAYTSTERDLGHVATDDILEELEKWCRYLHAPRRLHFDPEGGFISNKLKKWCAWRNIRPIPTAGDAHHQIGIVERHIGTLRQQLDKSFSDHHLGECSLQEIVDLSLEAKNSHGTYDGFSPRQWMHSRTHPLLQADAVSPNLTPGSNFENHLERRMLAAQHFHYADARNLLRLAVLARSRVLSNPQVGDVVYYFRRHRSNRPQYFGPGRVLAVEPPEVDAHGSSVVWISHSGTLIRAAPEHLRQATPLEVQMEEIAHPGASRVPSDLGAPPTDDELVRSGGVDAAHRYPNAGDERGEDSMSTSSSSDSSSSSDNSSLYGPTP